MSEAESRKGFLLSCHAEGRWILQVRILETLWESIKWVIEIVDIYVRISTIQMKGEKKMTKCKCKGVEFRKHKPVSKGH